MACHCYDVIDRSEYAADVAAELASNKDLDLISGSRWFDACLLCISALLPKICRLAQSQCSLFQSMSPCPLQLCSCLCANHCTAQHNDEAVNPVDHFRIREEVLETQHQVC